MRKENIYVSTIATDAVQVAQEYGFGLEIADNVPELLDEYVYYFNNRRPAAALGYKSPVQYKTELGF